MGKRLLLGIITLVSLSVLAASVAPKPGVDWPSFRGIQAAGIAEGFALPTTWNVPTDTGVRWKTAIEGLGHSSPVIWGDRLYVTSAVSGRADAGLKPGLYGDISSVDDTTPHTWKLIGLDKKTGRINFNRTIHTGVPKVKRHLKSTHASSTLATDGTTIVAMLGSEGLYAFDMDGKPLWTKDLGLLDSGFYMVPDAQWEFGSSPVIHKGVVIIQADVQKNSFLAAYDAKTGSEMWRTPRSDVPTWGTPTILEVGGNTEVIVNGWRHAGAYDFKTGKEIWTLNGGGDIPVPTPIAGQGLIFLTNAHGPGSPVYAIRDNATGDISLKSGETKNDQIVWSVPRGGSYMATPLLYRDLLYVCAWQGVLSAYVPSTGERLYQERLGAGTSAFTASAVAGDGKLYLTSEDGDAYVVTAGKTFSVAATNSLGESVFASPAISEGVIYFRTAKNILAIGK